MAGPRILVVYYSPSGTMRKIAEALSEALTCDLEEIVVEDTSRGRSATSSPSLLRMQYKKRFSTKSRLSSKGVNAQRRRQFQTAARLRGLVF